MYCLFQVFSDTAEGDMSAAHRGAHRRSGDVIAGHHGKGQGHLLQVSQYFHNVSQHCTISFDFSQEAELVWGVSVFSILCIN